MVRGRAQQGDCSRATTDCDGCDHGESVRSGSHITVLSSENRRMLVKPDWHR